MESNSTQWSALLASLKELISWCNSQQNQILINKQQLQPDINIVSKQICENKVFMCNIEYKKSIIESTLASAKLYYDDRVKFIELSTEQEPIETNDDANKNISFAGIKKKLSSKKRKNENRMKELKIDESCDKTSETSKRESSVAIENEDEDLDDEDDDQFNGTINNKMTPNELAKHLVNKIDRKVQLLDRLWQELNRQALNYNNTLLRFHQNLQEVYKLFDTVGQSLNEHEVMASSLNVSVSGIESDKLADELDRVKNFQLKVSAQQPMIDEMCVKFAEIGQELRRCDSKCAVNVGFNSKFDDLNLRWTNLQGELQEKYLHMYSLMESSGASIFLKLTDSVHAPWQRGISATNKVPYYIK